jgi:CrcB protein
VRVHLVALVFLGGGLGSVLRYVLGTAAQRHLATDFPAGTLLVNLLGCLGVGLVGTLGLERAALSAEARTCLMVGLLGGFTTFSSFAWETLGLVSDRETLRAALYALLSLTGGLTGAYLGRALGRMLT